MSMEFTKKWVVLGAVVVCGLALAAGWEFYGRVVAPLRLAEAENRRYVADLRQGCENARRVIAEMRAREQDAARARREIERLESDLPVGSAAVRVPAILKEHFAHVGIAVPLIRLNSVRDEPGIPGCERGFWSVALPVDKAGRNVTTMFLAVADLDQQNPFIRVLDFAIRPDPENPGGLVGVLNVAGVVRTQASH